MAAKSASKEGGIIAPLSSLADNMPRLILRLVLLMVLDAWAIVFAFQLIRDGDTAFGVALALVVLAINIVFLRTDAVPLRWVAPALAFMAMMHIYPVMFTVYTAFTNFGDGHLVEKPLAIEQIEKQTYIPESGVTYSWTVFQTPSEEFGLWLVDEDGNTFWAIAGVLIPVSEIAESQGELNEDGIPTFIGDYQQVPRNRRLVLLGDLEKASFGPEEAAISILSGSKAAQAEQRFVYDEELDAMIDQTDGTVYANIDGAFTSEEGAKLIPGFPVTVGFLNFKRILTNPAIRGPFTLISAWTFAYAFISVIITFSLGLFLAIILNDPDLPARRLTRVLMIVPYAIPAFISVLIWRGMFNPILGPIGSAWNPGWFSSPFWAKVGILIIQLWLGFPYMFLIVTGALQGIPTDIYEAARVDGAGGIYRFWRITLPLLLISVGPLLIGSFAFNFNNFTIIDLYNEGGPPIAGAATPAGHTDIMISYTFRLAFAGGRGADYGLASAVAIIIFIIVAAITLFNFRYTGMLEEASENV